MNREATPLERSEELALGPARTLAALERIRPRLKRVFANFRVPWADAEDLVQNLALLALTKGSAAANLESWLMGAAWNLCRLRLRKRMQREESPLDSVPEPLAPCEEDEWICRVDFERCLLLLPPRHRSVLRLLAAGVPKPEIAAKVGYSNAGIRKLILRDIARLAARQAAGDGGQSAASALVARVTTRPTPHFLDVRPGGDRSETAPR